MKTNNTVIIFQKGSLHLLSLNCNSEIQLKPVEDYIHFQYYEQVVTALNGERLELQSIVYKCMYVELCQFGSRIQLVTIDFSQLSEK